MTCASSAAVGGHYYYPLDGTDPWTSTTYTTNDKGSGYISATIAGFSTNDLGGFMTAYRTLVLHGSTSAARLGCGVVGSPAMGVSLLDIYPGYTGSLAVLGTVAVTETEVDTIYITGTLTGLEASKVGGVHIHCKSLIVVTSCYQVRSFMYTFYLLHIALNSRFRLFCGR